MLTTFFAQSATTDDQDLHAPGIQNFLDQLIHGPEGATGQTMGAIMMILSVIMVLITIINLAFGQEYRRFGNAIVTVTMATFLLVMGQRWVEKGTSPKTAGSSTSDPTSSPTPSPEVTPSPTPSSEVTSEPIEIPSVVGWENVLPILAVLVAATVLLFSLPGLFKKKDQRTNNKRISALIASEWKSVLDSLAALNQANLHRETDWDTLFRMPLLQDMSVPEIAAAHEALGRANRLAHEDPPSLQSFKIWDATAIKDAIERNPLTQAVREAESAWQVAELMAKKAGTTVLPIAERQIVEEIQSLLSLARDAAASANEREIAYTRIDRLVKKLTVLVIPPRAMQVLESETRKALSTPTSTPSDTADTPVAT